MKKLTVLSFVALCFFGFAAESFAASAVSDKDYTTTYLVLGGVALAVLVFISVKTNTYLKDKFGYGLFQKSFI